MKVNLLNSTARVDTLVSSCIDAAIQKQSNPLLETIVETFKPQVDEVLTEHLGPGTAIGRTGEQVVSHVQKFHRRLKKNRERRGA